MLELIFMAVMIAFFLLIILILTAISVVAPDFGLTPLCEIPGRVILNRDI